MAEQKPYDVDGARKAGLSDGEIADYLAKKTGYDAVKARQAGLHDADIIDYITGKSAPPKNPSEVSSSLGNVRSVADAIKIGASSITSSPFLGSTPQDKAVVDPATIASIGAGIGAGAITKSPFIGSAAQATVDKFLKYATGKEQYEDPLTTAGDIAGNTAINEIGGRVFSAPFKLANVGKAVLDAHGVIDPLTHPYVAPDEGLSKLAPTFAQTLRSKGSRWAGLADSFENLLAPDQKAKAVKNSFGLAKDAGDDFIADLSGRAGLKVQESDKLAQAVQDASGNQAKLLKIESNARGEQVKQIAQINPESVPIYETQTSKTVGADGKPITTQVKVGDKTVYGPIDYQDTMQSLIKLKSSMMSPNIKPDPNNPILKAINDMFEGVNAKFDNSGKLISYDKTDFARAWADKQIAGKLGYEINSLPDNVQTNFKNLNHAIDNDIQSSMAKWTNGGDKAADLFNETNSIVKIRQNLFNPKDEVGKSIDDLINNSNAAKANVYAILDDPKKLGTFLATNKIVIPNGTDGGVTNIKYISSNAKRDAQAAMFQRALNGAEVPSNVDPTRNVFNPSKLQSFINDPEKQETLTTIFGSEGLSNVKQLFKNIAFTAEKGGNQGASRYLGLKASTYGITLLSGIAGLLTSGSLSTGALTGGIGLGATVGAHGLARLMTNPETARLMISMSQGQPLNMSVKLATRMIASTLRNQPITIENGDGTSVDGKINSEGKFVIPFKTSLN